MKWTEEAEAALSRVPFFVRRRVRRKVEEEATRAGASIVTMESVTACRDRFMKNMDKEVKGYQLETCFGSDGCPNSVRDSGRLVAELERILQAQDLRAFLKSRVAGPLKLHHEFRVTVANCPNACSRPQISDLGIIAARGPKLTEEPCSGCGACVEACAEAAIALKDSQGPPELDLTKCVMCGQCVGACPTGSLASGPQGFRIMVGGKLGRRPQLATELPGVFSEEQTILMARKCLDHYKSYSERGERFGEIINRTGLVFLGELSR